MLVLARKKGQTIVIGDNILVTVVEIRGDKVRLGVEAPREVPVHRQEVYDAINRERVEGSRTTADAGSLSPPSPEDTSLTGAHSPVQQARGILGV